VYSGKLAIIVLYGAVKVILFAMDAVSTVSGRRGSAVIAVIFDVVPFSLHKQAGTFDKLVHRHFDVLLSLLSKRLVIVHY
jgi:hypothetical protein